MTTLVQLNNNLHRRYDFNMHAYRELVKKGKGLLAMRFLCRAEHNQEHAEAIKEVMKETGR